MLLYSIVLVIARKRHWLVIAFNAPSASPCARLWPSQRELFEGYIYLRTLLFQFIGTGKREIEWIIVVSHQIEKGTFWGVPFREFSRSVRWSYLYREARGSILFEHGTTDQQLAKREGVSCDARGKLLNSCFLRWRPCFFRLRKGWVLGAMEGI